MHIILSLKITLLIKTVVTLPPSNQNPNVRHEIKFTGGSEIRTE